MFHVENAAPSTALPLGSTRILSPTRLTRIDPSGPAHITRLLNAVLALVAITPSDRIKSAGDGGADPTIKEESEAKVEPKDGSNVKEEVGEGADAAHEAEGDNEGEEIDDEDEVPFREEIGYREVLGFIVM